MSDGELLTIIATIVSALLFTGIVYVLIVGVLVSLLVGAVDLVARLAHRAKEAYGYSNNGRRRNSLDRRVVVARQQKRRLT
jgi:MFS superfamily sulfate permease-like transporter